MVNKAVYDPEIVDIFFGASGRAAVEEIDKEQANSELHAIAAARRKKRLGFKTARHKRLDISSNVVEIAFTPTETRHEDRPHLLRLQALQKRHYRSIDHRQRNCSDKRSRASPIIGIWLNIN